MTAASAMRNARPSKVVKPSKNNRRSTPHTRNHRFQSFSERIANLKIDPIRRRRSSGGHEEQRDETATYFGSSLAEWRDLNLSQTFTTFVKRVSPYCDSLPVVLHYENEIMALMSEYIEIADGLAMEPLLNLLSHFAHDLDVRFEKHFERAVATVSAVAAKHQDPAVVEWSFTCLAWLFKYLSRLLAPDLRPLYDLMSPYLGKQVQKPFVIRFAAESLSFLLRKTAMSYDRDPKPLNNIIRHILHDCINLEDPRRFHLYKQGVMTLLTEAIKSVRNGIHSTGPAIVRSILEASSKMSGNGQLAVTETVVGVTTSLIHHTNAESFQTVLEPINTFVQHHSDESGFKVRLGSSLIFTVTSVRKGTRIADWKSIVACVQTLIRQAEDRQCFEDESVSDLLGVSAVTLHSATNDALLPMVKLIENFGHGPWAASFLQFCDHLARLDKERFRTLVLPQFQKFASEHWERDREAICEILPRLASHGLDIAIDLQPRQKGAFLQRLNVLLSLDADGLPQTQHLASANALIAALPHLMLSEQEKSTLSTLLLNAVQRALHSHVEKQAMFQRVAMVSCFRRLLDFTDDKASIAALWVPLCTSSARHATLPDFWSNLNRYMELCPPSDLTGAHIDLLEDSIPRALALPSHEIRQSTLDVLANLYKVRGLSTPDVLLAAITLESTPSTLDASRSISLYIRRIAAGYPAVSNSDELMEKAMPNFCFGLLHIKLAHAWEDVAIALAEMCNISKGEEHIVNLVQMWLDGSLELHENDSRSQFQTILDAESNGFQITSDFECSNFARMTSIHQQVYKTRNAGYPSAEDQLYSDCRAIPLVSQNAREQALRVLAKVPQIAQKRSRMLVPILLKWAGNSSFENMAEEATDGRWSRKDQKAMLEIFAQFTNPKVLFKSGEVYHALLNLSANGDVEIQRSALKAIFAWKDPAIAQYQEHLVNILDEARFREEISVFLRDPSEDGAVKVEHFSQLLPLLLRLLYGRAVAGGKHEQKSRRKAVFVALSRFGQESLHLFIEITMSRIIDETAEIPDPTAPLRQQFGMLNMINDLLETLAAELEPFSEKLLNAARLCAASASKRIEDSPNDLKDGSLLRSIRQVGMQCIFKIFAITEHNDFSEQASIIIHELVVPRLRNFGPENAQSISGMLRLFAAWSAHPSTAHYLIHEKTVLYHVAGILQEPSTKDEVRLFVLQDILDRLMLEDIDTTILKPYVSAFVKSIGYILAQQTSRDVIDACVKSFTSLSARIVDIQEAKDVMRVCTRLLMQPNKTVTPPTKTGLLETMLPLLDHFEIPTEEQLFGAMCGLCSRVKHQKSRLILSEVLLKLSRADSRLAESAAICEDLNAQSGRLDEPDYERRERGYSKIFERSESFSTQQWLPIIHNCMFFVRDADDLVNRSSSSQALARFIEAATQRGEEFHTLIKNVLLPGIEHGIRESSELVRAEHISLLGRLVEGSGDWPTLSDLRPLIVGGDDEASFFNNILHIQQHRRLRALRRLVDEAPNISSNNISKIFLPLLEHFVFDQVQGDTGRTLADQTIVTISALAKSVSWSILRATFKRYTGYISSKENLEKTVLRLIGALVDAVPHTSNGKVEEQGVSQNIQKVEIVTRDFLPPLTSYLHRKDESTVDRRVPVAVTIVKLLLTLPEPELSARLPSVLTDISHVLRSRSQEARDQTRKALAAILALIGPAYFGFMLKELRSALQRGYQLHVLSFTVHALLIGVVDKCRPGDLDHCLHDLVSVIMDDTFGITGQEKDAEEYKSGMKEIKSSKSFDTMELLAKVTPINRLGQLIKPLRALLTERLDSKIIKKAEELLIRLRKGIDQNSAADSRDMLIFCHEIVRQVYAEQNASILDRSVPDYRLRKYLIQIEAADKSSVKGATASQMFKLASFALNLVRRVLRRHEDLMTPSNMAGFLPMIGDALVQNEEEVKLAALRLLGTLIKVPLAEIERNAPVYVKEAVALIKSAPNTTTESSKAALELITSVLREKRSVTIKDDDVALILKHLKPDIDEPDRQGVMYKFLRAVLARKILITEVYEIMVEVGKALVTNPDRNVRETARSAYFQFIMEYPQGQDRWNRNAGFLVENLKYEHAAGRQSVMELLHQLLPKLANDTLAQLGFTFFIALVPVQASDSDQTCRQMAGVLLAKLFERAENEQVESFLLLTNKWLANSQKPMIQVAALHCWSTYLRAIEGPKSRQEGLRDKIASMLAGEDVMIGPQLLQAILQTFAILVEVDTDTSFSHAAAGVWDNVERCLAVAEPAGQELAAKLISSYFSCLASHASRTDEGLSAIPLRSSGGLEFDDANMRQTCRTSLRVFMTSSDDMTESLATQTIRNLAFLGRCFAANEMVWQENYDSPAAEDSDEIGQDSRKPEPSSSALAYLLNRLSYIIRQDNYSSVARSAAIQCQATIINQLDRIPNLKSVLRPLYSLTDPSIPQPTTKTHNDVVDKARELLDLIQKKVGVEIYVNALGEARKEVKAKREERRQKRKISAISAPEKWARDKKRKHEAQRTKKKDRGMEMRGRRRGW